MMSFLVTRQHLCGGFLVLLVLLSYLMYANLDLNLSSFSICKKVSRPEPGNASSPQVLQNPNCTSDQQLAPQPPVRTEDDILILMWFLPFGEQIDARCSEFDMEGCQLTYDRSVYHKAHAVLFHQVDIHDHGMDNMPQDPRPWFQKWIWFTWESPDNTIPIPELSDAFNLTSSYRLDSHIHVPYGYLTPVEQGDESFKLPEKDKLVCWVVSNWNPQFKRVQVYEEMKNHIKMNLYGKAFNRGLGGEEYNKLIPSCKFYLSWENTIDRDYMTEKLFVPMRMGTVPVVLGDTRANYEEHIPGDSFIHVDDFASPKELAERLIYLDNNHTEYMKYFEWRQRCSEFDMEGCQLTYDRSVYHKAHAVLFHHRDIRWVGNMPQDPRPWFQKWIWFNWESPANTPHIPELSDAFNLTSSYRLDSHIHVPYGYLTPVEQGDESFKLPEKDKLVCWVVSNWNPHFKRVQVYEEMKNHIKMDLYGKAFNRRLGDEEYNKLIPSCKFYLSWENSIDRDYMTEKLFVPMRMGTVPVVLGDTRANYEEHIPGDSFIHVDDFASPKELAERLIYLDNNHTEYMQYFEWRQRYKVHHCFFVSDNVCRACKHLKMHKGYQRFHGLSKWFWG